MLINVKVVPKSSRVLVKKEGTYYKVYLTRPAQDGLANEQLIDILAEHLGIKRYRARIVRGLKSRTKTIEVDVAKLPQTES